MVRPLTTGVNNFNGGSSNDIFDGSLTATGAQTLNAADRLNGGGGLNVLDATLVSSVTPANMANIQVFDITAATAAANPGPITLGMINAGQATTLINDGSTQNLTFANVASGATNITVQNTGNVATTVQYLTPADVTAATLTLSNVAGGAAAITTIAGVETLNVVSAGAANTQILAAAAATAINFSGAVAQTITLDAATVNVSSFNASAATANVNLTLINQTGILATTDVTVLGGSGNDTLTVTAQTTSDVSINGGLGNDTFVFGANLGTGDTIVGGDGIDTLSATSAQLISTNTYTNISGIEAVTVSDALGGNVVLSQIQAGIDTVNLAAAASLVTGAARSITFDSGIAGNVNLNGPMVADAGTAGLTVISAGTGTSDTITIKNNNATGANVFARVTGQVGQDIIATGVETLVIDTYGSGALAAQTIGTIAVAGTGTAAETVNFVGANTVTTGAITATNINASGLTATTGTVFTATIGIQNSSVTGSGGNDSITSGDGNDTLIGGAGNDTLTAGAGVDSILGGEGNDRIVFATATNLTVADFVDGGVGVNTLSATADDITTNAALVDTADLAALGRVTNVSILEVTDIGGTAGADTVINAARVSSGITTINTVAATGAQATTFTFNSGASTLNLGQGLTTTAALGAATTLVAAGTGTADSITIVKATTFDQATFGTFLNTITGFETVNLNTGSTAVATTQTTGAIALTGTGTNPALTINVTGANELTLGAVTTTGTGLLTINASGMTAQAADLTFTLTAPVTTGGTVSITGSAGNDVLRGDIDNRNTIEGGAGADSITGGSAADFLSGGDGADTIIGDGGSDTILGGDGADQITVAVALADTISVDGGAGNDIVTVTNFNNVNATDTIRGGDGVDTLAVAVVNNTATAGAGITEFETLSISTAGNASQAMTTVFTNDTTINRIDFTSAVADAGNKAVTAASAGLTQVRLNTNTSLTVERTTDTATNALTIAALAGRVDPNVAINPTVTTVTVNDEESLSIAAGGLIAGDSFTVTTLNAIDLTNLTIAGVQNTAVTLGASAAATGLGTTARGVTVDASTATGTVNLNMATALATQALTMTGSSTASSTLIGGLGNDTLTGGDANDTLQGGLGADVINGGAGVNTFSAVGMNATQADGGVANSVGAVINLGATTLTAAAIDNATGGLRTSGSAQAVASNTTAYLASTASGGVGLATTVDTLANIQNVIGSAGTDYIVGSAGANVITGGLGADTMTGGLGADVFVYNAVNQGGAAVGVGANALAAGDVITDFTSGAGGDRLAFIGTSLVATGAAAAAGAAGTWNMNTNGIFIITGSTLNVTAGTTTSAQAATAIGNLTGDANDVGYLAIENTAGTEYSIFQVTLNNARAGAAAAGTDTIALLGTVTTADLVAADFVFA